MKTGRQNLSWILCALGLNLVLSACGLKNGANAVDRIDNSAGGDNKIRREAFRTTLYPIVRRDCVSCHGASRTPLFAAEDLSTAYNAVLATVNWESLTSSNLVARSTDSHCGNLPVCNTDGSLFLSAVKAMDDQFKQGTAGSIFLKWTAIVDAGTEETLAALPQKYEAAFTLSRAVDREIRVAYQVLGTATIGTDHELLATGEVVIAALAESAKIQIPVTDDAFYEPDETIVLKLLPAEGIEITGNDSFTLTVQNSGDPAPSLQWSQTASSVAEGVSATLAAELSGPCTLEVSVPVAVTVPAGVLATEIQISPAI